MTVIDSSQDLLGQAPGDDSMELALSTSAVEAALFGVKRSVHMGRFVLLDELGRGGMGVVYSAWDPQLDRRVALKVVRPELGGQKRDARMLREAKAAARLSDPHIVTVLEVGESDGRVFIAMEYVEGETLGAYTAAAVGVRTCVELYVQAARGLAAAHAAGIVHRDFKPGNVLVSGEADRLRAQVTDFGVARVLSTPDAPSEHTAHAETELTVDGALLGTPAYMAPEQFEGAKVGPAADQFSFCVALFEALHGVRPFAGDTVAALQEAVAEGRLAAARTDAPSGVVAAIRRGLAPTPEARHTDMLALVAALERGLHRRRRTVTLGGIGVAIGLAAVGGAMGSGSATPPPPQCEGLAAAWEETATQGDAVVERMAEPSTLRFNTRAAIDDYGERWVEARTTVCEATHVRGTQSPALLDLRVACLDQMQLEASGLFVALATSPDGPDPQVLDAISRLDAPSHCVDANARSAVVPPEDPRRRQAFDALQRELAAARTDFRLSRWKAGMERTTALLEAAQGYGDDHLLALAMSIHATFQARVGDPKQAAVTAKEALMMEVEAGNEHAASTAATGLVFLTGYLLGDTESAETFGQLALAWAGDDQKQRAAALENLGLNAFTARDYDLAESRHRAAQALLEPGPDSIPSAINLAAALLRQDDPAKTMEAQQLLRETLALAEDTYGDDHTTVAALLQNLTADAPVVISYEEATPMLERALAIKTRTLGADAVGLVSTLTKLSTCRRAAGDGEAALTLVDRAIEILETKLGPETPKLLGPHERRIEALVALGRLDEAEAQLEATMALADEAYGLDDPENYGLFFHRASILRARGDDAAALPHQRRAVEMARQVSTSSVWTREHELALAELHAALGQDDEARALASLVRDETDDAGPLAAELRERAAALLQP